MKKLSIFIIICFFIILFRENICFFYGNVLGVFKLDNNYYEGIIKLKDESIKNLKNEFNELNDFKDKIKLINYDYKLSKIIYKDIYGSEKYTIQFGKNNKVNIGNAIFNEYGLVGRIYKVDKDISYFETLKVIKNLSVKINDNYGKMNYDAKLDSFIIDDISNYDKVYINDDVYTSGYGEIKQNLFIGKVYKIENKTISKKIYVKSNVDFNKLNYVLIIGDFNDNS